MVNHKYQQMVTEVTDFMDLFTICACRSFYAIAYQWSLIGKLVLFALAALLIQSAVSGQGLLMDLCVKGAVLLAFFGVTLQIMGVRLQSVTSLFRGT